MDIGFMGLGIMGSRMAARLLRAGRSVTVHNRTPSKAEYLLAEGAGWAASPAGLASGVDVLFTMLAHPGAVLDAALGERGFLDGLRPGSLWVDCSTVHPTFSREMAAEAAARGLRFLDAPVSGSRGPAEQGELVFLVGGEASDVEACRPLFEAMGRRVVHAGAHGMGTSIKLVANSLLATAMAAFSEALVFGEAMGLPRATLFDFLLGSHLVAPFLSAKRGKIEAASYEPDFPLQWMHKDLHMASLAAWESGAAMPLVQAAKEEYALALRRGLGAMDFSAVHALLAEGVAAPPAGANGP